MDTKRFKEMVEYPVRTSEMTMLEAQSLVEQMILRANGIAIEAAIKRTIRLCVQYPEQAKEYYDSLPKAITDKED